jgi:hypothetical protein
MQWRQRVAQHWIQLHPIWRALLLSTLTLLRYQEAKNALPPGQAPVIHGRFFKLWVVAGDAWNPVLSRRCSCLPAPAWTMKWAALH